MKKLALTTILCAACLLGTAQKAFYKQLEFSLLTGYYQPLGIFGAKLGYYPKKLNGIFQFTTGIGGGRAQSLRMSAGMNFLPIKDAWVRPYLGADYSFGLGTPFGNADGSERYNVGFHHYISPYAALRIKTRMDQLTFKLKLGYTNLLNETNIKALG